MNDQLIGERINRHIDDLVAAMRIGPAERRSIGNEWRAHLHESVAELVDQGWEVEAAVTEAVARFGPTAELTRAMDTLSWRRDLRWAALQPPAWLWCWLGLEVLAVPLWSGLLWPQAEPTLLSWVLNLSAIALLLFALLTSLRLGLARMRRADSLKMAGLPCAATVAGVWLMLLSLRLFLPWANALQTSTTLSEGLLRALPIALALTLIPVYLAFNGAHRSGHTYG